jgi:hypothetical protein
MDERRSYELKGGIAKGQRHHPPQLHRGGFGTDHGINDRWTAPGRICCEFHCLGAGSPIQKTRLTVISAKTIGFHCGKHHQGYVTMSTN